MPMRTNWQIQHLATSPSSNDALAHGLRNQSINQATALLVDEQTAGKGRMGRSWLSDPHTSLTFSVAHPIYRSFAELSGLSLACGLKIWQGIAKACSISKEELYARGCRLKWPNDLYIHNQKVGGILIEAVSPQANQHWLVIGIGLNLLGTPQHSSINQAGSLSDILDPRYLVRENLFRAILDELADLFQDFAQGDFSQFQAEWNRWHLFQNLECQILQEGQVIDTGIALGVDTRGQLELKTSTGIRKIMAGDVSLRKQA